MKTPLSAARGLPFTCNLQANIVFADVFADSFWDFPSLSFDHSNVLYLLHQTHSRHKLRKQRRSIVFPPNERKG